MIAAQIRPHKEAWKMKKITYNSTLGELYDTPVGHDVVEKILLTLGIPKKMFNNPAVRQMNLGRLVKAGTLARYFGKELDAGFADTLLALVNSCEEEPGDLNGPITPAWWKEAVFYQIYPRSFKDSDGDGIGDLPGICEKLDYLKDLGVDALWLSPVYDSPNDDNGYDIRDYRKIMSEFGTMEDFDHLLEEVHKRKMRLIMDLVVNHTSDEHEWFQKALHEPDSKYRNYYFFRPDDGLTPPNNWDAFFGGTAWNYYPEQDLWGLHLFSKKQMDLNWDNPDVRRDVIEMIRFWLDKGVDGFRMDVINYISKTPGLPDGDPTVGDLVHFKGIEHYLFGPHLHEYLREIRKEAFDPYNAFSVGETPGFGMKMSQLTTAENRHELDMVFAFDHLETPGHNRYDDYKYDLNYYRDFIVEWMEQYGNQCRMSLFYNNHDNPRMVSKIDPRVSGDPLLRRRIEALLAVMQFTLKGTPFVFQGDEMGLVNYPFASIDEMTDVEVHGLYNRFMEIMAPEEAFERALSGTRDHARVLLPWNHFPDDYPERMKQTADPVIFGIYKTLIALRKHSSALLYGNFRLLDGRKNHFTYLRRSKKTIYVIDCNLCAEEVRTRFDGPPRGYTLVFDSEASVREDGRSGGTAAGAVQRAAECAGVDGCSAGTAAERAGVDGCSAGAAAECAGVHGCSAGIVAESEMREDSSLTGEPLPILTGRSASTIAQSLYEEFLRRGRSGSRKDELVLAPYEARIWRKDLDT